MIAKSSCIRAVPHDTNCTEGHDSPDISMCLYMDTAGQGITDDLREESGKYFSGYNLKFVDLECDPLGKYFSPRDCKLQSETHEMATLAQIIEKNLPLFENRLNVTAVYPSYKISEGQETDDLCITISVLGKGLIPVGENEFSKILDGHPLDIVEGYFSPTNGPFLSQASPLHLGVGIGVRGKRGAGTLGAILTDEADDFYVLSCDHVLSKKNEKPASAKKQPSRKQPAEEQTAEENYIDGVKRLENYISEKRERLVEKNRESLNELEKINVTKEIEAFESAVRIPGEEEILIEQPAAEDFISEMNKLEKDIREERSALERLENRALLEEWRKKANKSNIQVKKNSIKTFESKLSGLTDFGLPRWIATYSYGLRQNYEKSGRKFFVDAAIAKINADECDDILSLIKESDSVYGFDEQKKMNRKGEIVPLSEIETKADNATFWKTGRTTSHTEGGRFRCEHFYAKLKGFNEYPCFGEFTNVKFQTYCKTCAPKTCSLFDTFLLEEVKCYKCKEAIPKKSKHSQLWAYNCFLVSRKEPFSKEGDSGAVIFDQNGRAWGIIVGLFDVHRTFTVAISLDIALEALKLKSGKELKLLCVNPS